MDPFLEDADHWRGFHNLLAAEILRQLNPLLVPKYYADIEVHESLEDVVIGRTHSIYPDVAILEQQPRQPRQQQQTTTAATTVSAPITRTIEIPEQFKLRAVRIYETATNLLITTIEILSPANKNGEGLREYQRKRSRLLRSEIHLVEIDLLRGGARPGREIAEPPLDTDYVVVVNRADQQEVRTSEIWPIALNEPLPPVPIPLTPPDADVILDLAAVFRQIYQDAYYGVRIDYTAEVPAPRLRPAMAAWWTRAAQARQ
jgi:hypothetical protein